MPDLPITEIARSEIELAVGQQVFDVRSSDANDWVRFNDYGIGLLLQDDTQGAARAFARVAELAPERLDGARNLARTALRDGNLNRRMSIWKPVKTSKKGTRKPHGCGASFCRKTVGMRMRFRPIGAFCATSPETEQPGVIWDACSTRW